MKSPWDLLPIKEPKEHKETPDFFYENILKPLLKDVLRIQHNGIPIDVKKTEELKSVLDDILRKVDETLIENPLIQEFQKIRSERIYNEYKKEIEAKKKSYTHYLKPFSVKNTNHRNALMNYLTNSPVTKKWLVKDIKANPKLSTNPIVLAYLSKQPPDEGNYREAANKAMELIAKEKARLVNLNYQNKIDNPPKDLLDKFNPGSSKQKQEFFKWLGIESEKTSKTTGEPSWDKDEVERVNKETLDPNLKTVTQAMIDYSQAAIIRKNFIAAFDKYVIDNVLYGNFKLFGTKTMRLTSNKP